MLFAHLPQEAARFLLECAYCPVLSRLKRSCHFPLLNGKKEPVTRAFDIKDTHFDYNLWHIPAVSERKNDKEENNIVQIETSIQWQATDTWRNSPEKALEAKTTEKKTFCLGMILDL